jgi:DNA ligase-1
MQFRVFDCADVNIKDEPFILRLEHAGKLIKEYKEHFFGHVSLVEHTLIEDYDELVAYEDIQLALGYEGIMMRDPSGPYKHGRGTYKQGYIYKLKRFTDTEGVIVGFVEQNTNTNEDTKSELGYAKRSSSKEGMALAGTLGKFLVDYNGITIPVGPGHFDHKQRKLIWENPCLYINKILKYRYFAHGMKDLPRHPRALGWRDKMDM